MAYYYKGAGKVYIGPYDGTSGMRYLSNVSELQITFNTKDESLQDYDSIAGGTVMKISTIEKAEISITLNDFSPENLALALWGGTSAVNAGNAIDTITVKHGCFNELIHINPSTVSFTGSGSTYIAGTDYVVSGGGIYFPSTSTVPEGSLPVSYNYPSQTVMECLTGGAIEWRVILDGINIANSNKPVKVKLFKVKFNPAKDLNFKGEKFGELKLQGDLLKDDSITGVGKSQYFQEVVQL